MLGLAAATGLGLGCVIVVEDDCGGVECGDNAYCERGICECVGGYDGDPDDRCDPVQTIWIQDECDDGLNIEYVFWAQDREWRWPAEGTYETPDLGDNDIRDLTCIEGELICFGAEAGGLFWGVGLDGSEPCSDCCFECFADTYDLGFLECG